MECVKFAQKIGDTQRETKAEKQHVDGEHGPRTVDTNIPWVISSCPTVKTVFLRKKGGPEDDGRSEVGLGGGNNVRSIGIASLSGGPFW